MRRAKRRRRRSGAKREPARAKPQSKIGDTVLPNRPPRRASLSRGFALSGSRFAAAVAPPLLCEEGNTAK